MESINYHRRFLLATFVNLIFVVIEIYYGLQANSVALLSDALHNISDILGLLVAWGGFFLATLRSPARFTYGFKNTTILGAFMNALFIFMMVGAVIWEALQRLKAPPVFKTEIVIWVAAIGLVINGFSAFLFAHGKKDINLWGAFIHLFSDALVSLGVVFSTLVVVKTNWWWLDPLVSLTIAGIIALSSWGLFKGSIHLMLLAIPPHIDGKAIERFLLAQEGVVSIHDLHIWALSTTETALSVHLVQTGGASLALEEIIQLLKVRFHIAHATIQLEQNAPLSNCTENCGINSL